MAILLSLGMTAAVSAAVVDTSTQLFSSAVKSLRTTVSGNPLAPPVIMLGTPDHLTVEFDELAEDYRYLRYRLIHCQADWTVSRLVESEYVEGFNVADVHSYALSEQTLAHYVHYSLTIPNGEIAPMVSGNYLLQVFDEENPDDVLLQTRFMVTEGTASLSASVTSRTDVDYNSRHHQLSVEADLEGAAVGDPFNDLRLAVVQNGRTDNMTMVDKPLRIGAKRAVWEHQKPLIFPAGNEYRRTEMVTVHYPGMGVDHYVYADPYYHAVLTIDTPRSGTRYEYDRDQDGRFFPGELNAGNPDIEADYVVTHFTLEMPELTGREVWLDGDFTQHRRDADSRMVYSPSQGAYIKTMLLKQGLYNYQYLVTPLIPGDSATAPVEGDHYETDNEYLILLYHRPPMSRADRLIGATVIHSGK